MGTKKAKTTSKKQPKTAAPSAIAKGPGNAKSQPEPRLMQLPMEKILPTAENPRHHRLTVKDPSVIELAASIKGIGLLEPVIVRLHPSKAGFYELRAGERRFLAHQVNGAKTIPAILRAMDDQTAREVTTLENLQREDLQPLEEAEAVAMLLTEGRSTRDIAAKIGKSHQWVARRASLTRLNEDWQAFFQKHAQPAAIMELIARYPTDDQKALMADRDIKWSLEHGPAEVQDLSDMLGRRMKLLNDAPFALDVSVNNDLPCNRCPKRTGGQPELFDGSDKCLAPACYDAKASRALKCKEVELKTKHPDLIKITKRGYSGKKDVIGSCDYEKSKPGAKGARPALVVEGMGAGTVEWVKTTRDPEPVNEPKQTLEQKRAGLQLDRWEETIRQFRDFLEDTPVQKLDSPKTAILLTAAFGTGWDHDDVDEPWEEYGALLKREPKDQEAAIAELMWNSTRSVLSDSLACSPFEMDVVKDARQIATLIHFDLDKLFAKVSTEKGFTEPACWTAAKNSPTGSK